jgi:polar amino acid transport system ATP-binding protein/putative ABC transport system ATP-binding protein
MIECKNINLHFEDKVLFDNLNFRIEEGEHVCLSGVSGKGKTTLLKMVQGYIIPDDGQVLINESLLTSSAIKVIREMTTWIPQNVNLPVNSGMGLIKLLNIQSRKDDIKNYCITLGLDKDILTKNFDIISGGQKQRILISICLSLDKKIILIDEPTSSLDDKSIEVLIKLIKSLRGKTIFSASHNHLWVKSADKTINL